LLDSKTDYEMTALASETSLKNDTGAIKPIMLPDPEIIVFTDEHGEPMGGGANVQECREMAAWPYSSRQYYIPYSPSTKSLSERGKDEATGAWPLQEYIEDMILKTLSFHLPSMMALKNSGYLNTCVKFC
jgi:hypothetical protein